MSRKNTGYCSIFDAETVKVQSQDESRKDTGQYSALGAVTLLKSKSQDESQNKYKVLQRTRRYNITKIKSQDESEKKGKMRLKIEVR